MDKSSSVNRWETGATIGILVLSTISSVLGLFRNDHYADPAEGLLRIYAQDAVLLVIGIPVLTVGLWYAKHGSIRGRLVWLGSLAYMAYMWLHYAFVIAYNDVFLGYIALVGLSVFTLVSGMVRTDASAISQAANDGLSERIYSGFLAVAALGLGLMWLSDIVPAIFTGETPSGIVQLGPEATYTYVLDLAILVPSLAISAVWLIQRRSWGYVAAGVMLVFTALIAPTLTAITAVDVMEGIEMSVPILLGTIIPPLIGVVFAGGYLRGVNNADSKAPSHAST